MLRSRSKCCLRQLITSLHLKRISLSSPAKKYFFSFGTFGGKGKQQQQSLVYGVRLKEAEALCSVSNVLCGFIW